MLMVDFLMHFETEPDNFNMLIKALSRLHISQGILDEVVELALHFFTQEEWRDGLQGLIDFALGSILNLPNVFMREVGRLRDLV